MQSIALILLSSLLILAGCGPIYDTKYDLMPPSDEAGRFCVVECERINGDCRRDAQHRYDRCERDNREARDEFERCRRKHAENANKRCGSSASTNYCSSDTASCDSAYRRCFQNCGGEIHTRQVCVFNCP